MTTGVGLVFEKGQRIYELKTSILMSSAISIVDIFHEQEDRIFHQLYKTSLINETKTPGHSLLQRLSWRLDLAVGSLYHKRNVAQERIGVGYT